MSYNIDSIEIIHNEGFGISDENLAQLTGLEEVAECFDPACIRSEIESKMMGWYGMGSGATLDTFVEKVLPLLRPTHMWQP